MAHPKHGVMAWGVVASVTCWHGTRVHGQCRLPAWGDAVRLGQATDIERCGRASRAGSHISDA